MIVSLIFDRNKVRGAQCTLEHSARLCTVQGSDWSCYLTLMNTVLVFNDIGGANFNLNWKLMSSSSHKSVSGRTDCGFKGAFRFGTNASLIFELER